MMASEEQPAADPQRDAPPRQALELTTEETWQLLTGVSLGRVVFTIKAMPAMRRVNHLVDGETIIIRSHLGTAIVGHAAEGGAVVCYEADDLDPVRHTGGASSRPAPQIRRSARLTGRPVSHVATHADSGIRLIAERAVGCGHHPRALLLHEAYRGATAEQVAAKHTVSDPWPASGSTPAACSTRSAEHAPEDNARTPAGVDAAVLAGTTIILGAGAAPKGAPMIAQGSAQTQHAVRKLWEPTGNNG
jgi:hypothetical protein